MLRVEARARPGRGAPPGRRPSSRGATASLGVVPAAPVRPLLAGRVLAFAGILLVAANLRTAVAALSPLLGAVRHDVAVSDIDAGVLGMLPPVCFALFGFLAPRLTRRASLELVVVIALAVMIAGHLLRAAAGSFALLAAGSAVTFAGMAVGNVLLPPLVKRYFPDRVGQLTSLYATMLSICTFVPPLVAVPVSDATSWHVSLGMWASIAVVAAVPWLAQLARMPRAARPADGADVLPEAPAAVGVRVARSPLAWAMAVLFGTSSLNAYALFAWLPQLMTDLAGSTPAVAGAQLSLYGALGIPGAIVVPIVLARTGRTGALVAVAVGCFLAGDLGLLLAPTAAPWVWVGLAGLGPLVFPLCLTLINLRTRTGTGAVALSGFVQGVGYVLGALGPLVVGVLHEADGGWTAPLVFLTATALMPIGAGIVIARTGMLEDRLPAAGSTSTGGVPVGAAR